MQGQLIAQARSRAKFRSLRELQSGDPHPSRRVPSAEKRKPCDQKSANLYGKTP